jgi:CBS domain-containing protein
MKLSSILAHKDPHVVTITPQATIAQLIALLAQHRIGAVVVSADGRSIDGIVSERDVVRALQSGDGIMHDAVSSIMTSQVYCAPPEANVDQVMHVMTERRVRHIPMIDESGGLVGIVSIGDVVKSRLSELEGEREALMDYITRGG